MNVLVVYWHPEPQSFNGALKDCAVQTLQQKGHNVEVSDLNAMHFDPVSGPSNFKARLKPDCFSQQAEETYATQTHGFAPLIEHEMAKVLACDLMIWQFPLWWFGLPAMLKGWVDRVFAMGRLYGGGRVYETGVCRGKRALLSLTTGGPATAYTSDGYNGSIEAILRPIQRGMLEFVGFGVLAPNIVYGAARISMDERIAALDAYRRRLGRIEDEESVPAGRYA